MNDPTSRRSEVGKALGSLMIVTVFGFFFLVFWVARFLFKDAEADRFGDGKTLNDLWWSHLGSSTLFVALGALAIGLVWARPERRLRIALAGGLVGILTTGAFYLAIGQFNPGQGIGAGLFYLVIAALMVVSALTVAVLLPVAIWLLIKRQKSR